MQTLEFGGQLCAGIGELGSLTIEGCRNCRRSSHLRGLLGVLADRNLACAPPNILADLSEHTRAVRIRFVAWNSSSDASSTPSSRGRTMSSSSSSSS